MTFYTTFLATVAIVALFIVAVVWMNTAHLRHGRGMKSSDIAKQIDQKLDERLADADAPLAKLEERLANLETIVLEEEKRKEFDRKL